MADHKLQVDLDDFLEVYSPINLQMWALYRENKISKSALRYQRLKQTNFSQYEQILSNQCNFLFTNYTDIFNKLKKDEIDLTILTKFISVLERIENKEIDQHEGSYLVGQLLKELYIDSALKKSETLDKKNAKLDQGKENKILKPKHSISWKQFKLSQEE